MSDADRVVRFLIGAARCGDCGSSYNPEDVHVLDQVDENVWELAAVCPGCLSVWLVRAVVRSRGGPEDESDRIEAHDADGQPSMDDMTVAERDSFGGMSPIGVDDVLDLCSFLSTFDGDFTSFFGREPDGRS